MGVVGVEPTTKALCYCYCFHSFFRIYNLDYPFIRIGCLPSSLYTFSFLGNLARDCLFAIKQMKSSPNLTNYALKITFQAALQDHSCYGKVMNKIITCKICKKVLIGKQALYCSSTCKNKDHQSYNAQQARGLKRKLFLVGELGGECSICGYKKNSSALDLHHLNPSEKSFALDLRSLSNRKQSKIDEEIKKCILLCRNCHSEIHNPQHNLE